VSEQYRRPQTKSIRPLVLFPGALGDFLCALPALRGLAPATLAVRSELFDLLAGEAFRLLSIDCREIADLFGGGPIHASTRRVFAGHTHVHSWIGHGDANVRERLAAVTGGAVSIHRLRGMRPGEHASESFARSAGAQRGSCTIEPRSDALEWTRAFWIRSGLGAETLALHAGSGSPRKNWEGMAEAAEAWRRRGRQVLAIIGPAEAGRPPLPCDATLVEQPLSRVAAALRLAHRYAGNDSGISHLAGCVGVPGIVFFGPTDPATWRPQGSTLEVLHAPAPCPNCGPDRFCTHRLEIGVVLAALGLRDRPKRCRIRETV
jgi:hypothetical protein